MKISYHMRFSSVYTGERNKYGGQPTHLPNKWPTDPRDGSEMAFLCQIYCEDKIFTLPDTLCIQLYQPLDAEGHLCEGMYFVQIPNGAKLNSENIGLVAPGYGEGDITFEMIEEEDTFEENEKKNIDVFESKLLGWYPVEDFDQENTFLGWFSDENPFIIGAGYQCCLLADLEGKVITKFL